MHSIFKIRISRNMKCAYMVGFLKYSHIYIKCIREYQECICCLLSTLMTCHHVLTTLCSYLLMTPNLSLSNSNVFQLQAEMDALMEWNELRLLSFNIYKCKHESDSCSEFLDYMRNLGVV